MGNFITKMNDWLKSKQEGTEIEVGQKYIGKLDNEHKDEIITITKRMLLDDEELALFLHYYGFELMENEN